MGVAEGVAGACGGVPFWGKGGDRRRVRGGGDSVVFTETSETETDGEHASVGKEGDGVVRVAEMGI